MSMGFWTNGLMRAMNFIADIFILHLLWVLFSLPVFTIGASTAALYDASMRRLRTGEGYVSKNFVRAFKANFRQATLIWLGLFAVGFMLFTDIRYGLYLHNAVGRMFLIGAGVLLVPYICVLLYIFPVQAKFENRIFDNLKNALILSLRHFGLTLLLLAIWGTVIVLTAHFVPMMGLMLIMGAGLCGIVTSTIFIQIFRNYVDGELERDLEVSGEDFSRA